jgi:L-fuculose-phosphate aldolase
MNPKFCQHIVTAARKVAEFGFVAGYDGNVSLRSDEGIYITATHTLKAEATTDDVCLIDLDGKHLHGNRKPSTEAEMHLFIYRERADVGGIVHTHPPYATAFAAARKALDLAIFPEVILDIGAVPLADYATPSTPEVALSLKPFVAWANAILLANHGVAVMGNDIFEALYRTEKLEHAAKTLIAAEAVGGAVPLTKAQVDYLYDTHPTFLRRGNFADNDNIKF